MPANNRAATHQYHGQFPYRYANVVPQGGFAQSGRFTSDVDAGSTTRQNDTAEESVYDVRHTDVKDYNAGARPKGGGVSGNAQETNVGAESESKDRNRVRIEDPRKGKILQPINRQFRKCGSFSITFEDKDTLPAGTSEGDICPGGKRPYCIMGSLLFAGLLVLLGATIYEGVVRPKKERERVAKWFSRKMAPDNTTSTHAGLHCDNNSCQNGGKCRCTEEDPDRCRLDNARYECTCADGILGELCQCNLADYKHGEIRKHNATDWEGYCSPLRAFPDGSRRKSFRCLPDGTLSDISGCSIFSKTGLVLMSGFGLIPLFFFCTSCFVVCYLLDSSSNAPYREVQPVSNNSELEPPSEEG